PIPRFQCNDHTLDMSTVAIREVFYYAVTKGIIRNEHDAYELINMLYNILEKKNLNVKKMHAMKGKSGIMHTLSLYIDDYGGNSMIVEYCVDEHDGDGKKDGGYERVMSTIIKLMDLQVRHMILICIPRIREELRMMASSNNILVINGNNRNVLMATVLDIINSKVFQNELNDRSHI
ncbi:MAG: hypothetical protein RMJ59_07030, partial [Candidatus Nitrosocaldus sp.]|nr:hypothetical protein [Candidatus Nitrosocaldus sp.]